MAGSFDIRNLEVDLGEGTATGTWNGKAFSYTLSNIEMVRGSTGNDTLRGNDLGNRLDGGPGDDMLNPGDADGNADEYDEVEGSTGTDRIVLSEQTPPVWTGIHYDTLDSGITATIDGVANTATIDKGSAGTDTVVDVAIPMNSWALGLMGTRFDDVFDVTVGAGQNLHLHGGAGSDTFNIQSAGTVRLQFHRAPAGIDLDLGAGRVNDDGYGDADTVNGAVQQVRCTEFSDIVRGSDNDEWFECLAGDDIIDGGGGYDTLEFHRRGGAQGLIVFAGDEDEEGIATGIWNGKAFSYTFSNIEQVSGGPGIDIFVDSEDDDIFRGRDDSDLFILTEGGNDTIVDFNDHDDDILWLNGDLADEFGLTKFDVIAAAKQESGGVLLDFSSYGLGTIFLKNFNIESLSAGDIKL